MDTTALVAIGLAVLVIVLVLLFARGGRRGQRAMVPLADDSRDRYLMEWDQIEMRFVDAPEAAVREADALVMSLLAERRHPLQTRLLPTELNKARDEATRGRDRTEGMRRAMIHYRTVLEKMVGVPVRPSRERESRREMA